MASFQHSFQPSKSLPLWRVILLLCSTLATSGADALADQAKPIPDIASLIHQVQAHQRELDKTRENYTYRERLTLRTLDRKGNVKKVEQRESEVFFVNSHQLERLVSKDGQPLNQGEQNHEAERVQKEVEKAEHTPPGELMDDRGQVSVGRLLAIERFSNPRRLDMDHRSVLAFDFAGDSSASAHGVAENASKHLAGTIWIDEQDRQVRRLQAVLEDTFHLSLGLFSLSKGSSFSFDQKLVNNELWLPTNASIHIEAHAVAFIGYRADIEIVYDNYQRFHSEAH